MSPQLSFIYDGSIERGFALLLACNSATQQDASTSANFAKSSIETMHLSETKKQNQTDVTFTRFGHNTEFLVLPYATFWSGKYLLMYFSIAALICLG